MIYFFLILFQFASTQIEGGDFNREDFSLFIKALHSREIIRKEAKIVYLINYEKDKRYFSKRVKTQTANLCLRKTEYLDKKDLLKINSIIKSQGKIFTINFQSSHSGVEFNGYVKLKHVEGKSIFFDCYFFERVD
jgi:hypothetical protein